MYLSLGLRMALMRPTTAASTWMKHLPCLRCVGHPCRALWQRRRDGVIHGISASAAGEHGFCGGIALADAVVAPIDPKDMPTVTILHVV